MPVYCNIGGTWRTISQPSCRISEVWRSCQPSCNIGGTWRSAATEINVGSVTSVEFCIYERDLRDGSASQNKITVSTNSVEAYASRPSSSSYLYSASAKGVIVLVTSSGRYVLASTLYPHGVYNNTIQATGTNNIASNTGININASFSISPGYNQSSYVSWIGGIKGVFGKGMATYFWMNDTVGQLPTTRGNQFDIEAGLIKDDSYSSGRATYTVNSVTNSSTGASIPYSFRSAV